MCTFHLTPCLSWRLNRLCNCASCTLCAFHTPCMLHLSGDKLAFQFHLGTRQYTSISFSIPFQETLELVYPWVHALPLMGQPAENGCRPLPHAEPRRCHHVPSCAYKQAAAQADRNSGHACSTFWMQREDATTIYVLPVSIAGHLVHGHAQTRCVWLWPVVTICFCHWHWQGLMPQHQPRWPHWMAASLSSWTPYCTSLLFLSPSHKVSRRIRLQLGVTSVVIRFYRYGHIKKDEVECQCDEMLCQGVIRPSSSTLSSLEQLITERLGACCFCIN